MATDLPDLHPESAAPRRTRLNVIGALFAIVGLVLFNYFLYTRLSPASAVETTSAPMVVENRVLFNDFSTPDSTDYWWRQNGSWALGENLVRQIDPGVIDARMRFEAPISPMILSTRLRHVEGYGAGLNFDLQAEYSGNLVRFSEDGSGIIWGYFDIYNSFTPQGYAGLATPDREWHTLEIVRHESTYDIHLDNVRIASDIPRVMYGKDAALTTSGTAAEFDWVAIDSLVEEPRGVLP